MTKLNEWVNGEVYFQSDLLATEDYLFFTGGTPFNRQLWVTDGSAKNTKEIVVNPKGYSTPERFYLFKDKLIFFANGNGVGYEPHYVDISEITLNSVDENAVDSYFVIYPTPAKNEVRILTDFEYSSVSVFSIEGTQLIYSEKQDVLDISTLTNGIYIIKIKNKESNKSLIQKIIVSKKD